MKDMRNIEEKMIHEFKRRLHHYTSDVPAQDDILEWLALMQHHGAPTRLLDWTYSLFIATFFAVRKPQQGRSAIFALNKRGLDAEHLVRSGGSTWDKQKKVVKGLIENPRPLVCGVNPRRLNERLAIQQGLFIFPGDVNQPFERNINHAKAEGRLKKIIIEIGSKERREFILNLRRMNIDEASLFPGLEGFAESLHTRVAWHPLISEVT